MTVLTVRCARCRRWLVRIIRDVADDHLEAQKRVLEHDRPSVTLTCPRHGDLPIVVWAAVFEALRNGRTELVG
jgi:hypothetical protein